MLNGYNSMRNQGMNSQTTGLGAMRQAGMDQFGYDQYKTQAGLDQYQNNMYGQQGFYANQLNPLANVGQMFGTRSTRTDSNPSGMQSLSDLSSLAGSIYGMFPTG